MYCGVDVDKSGHYACALDLDGRRLHDRALSNDETELRAVFTRLQVHGRVLVVIDQPASTGALDIDDAHALGIDDAHALGLTMRRLADLHPGQARPTPATPTSSPTLPPRTRGHRGGSAPTMRPRPT